jgi:hypothetical protein
MVDVTGIEALARRRVLEGDLPPPEAFRTFGGSGSNTACALCEERIPAEVMEIEVECAGGSPPPRFILHVGCYTAWASVAVPTLRDATTTA